MILLDTNVVSELMRPEPHPGVMAWLDAQVEAHLYISSITKAEIEWGIAQLPQGRRKRSLQDAAEELLDAFVERCLAFDCSVTSHYVSVLGVSRTAGRPMSREDALIAAVAGAHGYALATRNSKDFRSLTDLRLIDPWSRGG